MSSSQRFFFHPHYINLSQFEKSIVQLVIKGPGQSWSCELCHSKFDKNMQLVTHLLTCCGNPSSLLSTKTAINICMVLDEPGPNKMLDTYTRVFGNEIDTEVSDLDSEMDSEVSDFDDVGLEASVEPKNGRTGKAATKAAGPPNQPNDEEFPARPPHRLSADEKMEWKFTRDRKCPLNPPTAGSAKRDHEPDHHDRAPRNSRDQEDISESRQDHQQICGNGSLEFQLAPGELASERTNQTAIQELSGSHDPVWPPIRHTSFFRGPC